MKGLHGFFFDEKILLIMVGRMWQVFELLNLKDGRIARIFL